MERAVQFVVVGGLLLVAGVWAATTAAPASLGWLLAAVAAAIGCTCVVAGIWLGLDVAA